MVVDAQPPSTFQPRSFYPPDVSPLSPEHLEQLARALSRMRKIRRAAAIALSDAVILAVFAGFSLLYGLLSLVSRFSLVSLLVGMALGVVAAVEFLGSRQIKRLDPRAPRWLGCNQLALAMLLITYALWSIYRTMTDPQLSSLATGGTGDASTAQMEELIRLMTWVVPLLIYGSLILVAISVQGLTALYYFTRSRHLLAYLTETPPWIVELQRLGVLG